MDVQQHAIDLLREKFPDHAGDEGEHAGQRWIEVTRTHIVEMLTVLRDEASFEFLMDLTAVDYLNQGTPERFCLVYELYSLKNNGYFRVKAWLPEDDSEIDTVSSVWKAAPWAEREVWDMFGITFRGHADLKRILLPEGYTGHPLRKDYPLTGHGERHDFERYSH